MTLFAFDSETYLVQPGRQAPRLVCVQSRMGDFEAIELREEGLDRLEIVLGDSDCQIVAHNTAYDVLVTIAARPSLLPLWLQAYEDDRVTDTALREKLIRIAMGTLKSHPKNSLLDLVKKYKIKNNFQDGDKDAPDAWRLRYHELDGIPVESWPENALRYARADLVVADVHAAQEQAPRPWLADQYRQARAALWLAWTSAWGMRVDQRTVEALREAVESEAEIVRDTLLGDPRALSRWIEIWQEAHPDARPLVHDLPLATPLIRPIGSKDTKAAAARMREVCRAKNLSIPWTKTGKDKVQSGEIDPARASEEYTALDADSAMATLDPILLAYARFTSVSTLRSRADRLHQAASLGLPIQPRFDVIKETGRTSASMGEIEPGKPVSAFGDQVQNLPRSPGLRECYVPREGCLILSVDWRAAELHTLAQTCLDLGLDSEMARVLNSGRDIHTWFGCQIRGWEYGDKSIPKAEMKAARQAAKAANFGYPGGLGIDKFRLYAAKTYQVQFTREEAERLKVQWLAAFPEMLRYFDHVSQLTRIGDPVIHHRSGRYRGGVRYTAAANSYFQGRAADMAKDAGWEILRATKSYGLPANLWNFAHDEFLLEVPEECAHEVSVEVVRIMEDAGIRWCPGAPVKAEPALQRRWRKGAEPVYMDGRLIPWEDRELSVDTLESIKKYLARGKSVVQASWVYGYTEERINDCIG